MSKRISQQSENCGPGERGDVKQVAKLVEFVESECNRRKLRLTPVRRRVLNILLERQRAMGAYEVLDILRQEGFGTQPPIVYRPLDFLLENGFIHRVRGANRFVACGCPGYPHDPVLVVCGVCNRVEELTGHELQSVWSAVEKGADDKPGGRETGKRAAFKNFLAIEIEGCCSNCAEL